MPGTILAVCSVLMFVFGVDMYLSGVRGEGGDAMSGAAKGLGPAVAAFSLPLVAATGAAFSRRRTLHIVAAVIAFWYGLPLLVVTIALVVGSFDPFHPFKVAHGVYSIALLAAALMLGIHAFKERPRRAA